MIDIINKHLQPIYLYRLGVTTEFEVRRERGIHCLTVKVISRSYETSSDIKGHNSVHRYVNSRSVNLHTSLWHTLETLPRSFLHGINKKKQERKEEGWLGSSLSSVESDTQLVPRCTVYRLLLFTHYWMKFLGGIVGVYRLNVSRKCTLVFRSTQIWWCPSRDNVGLD